MQRLSSQLIVTAVSLSLFLILTGCERLRPIHQVQGKPIPVKADSLSLSQIETQITNAGTSLGWLMKPIMPGKIRGTLRRGRHSAVVKIVYDTRSYDILYHSSDRMSEGVGFNETRYEGQKVIHKRYNKYVKILDRQIENHSISNGY